MKKAFVLIMICWCTHVFAAMDEYTLTTRDGSCAFHYLSPVPVPSDWNIHIEDGACLDKGYHDVSITDATHQVRDHVNGYFLDGYAIGATPLNTRILKRSTAADGIQEAFYDIENMPTLGIHFVGVARSTLQDQIYPAFDVCQPVQIRAVTKDKSLFVANATIQNVFTIVKSYAMTLCPDVKTIVFQAGENPYDNDVFFQEYLVKNNKGLWVQHAGKTFNKAVSDEDPKIQKEIYVEQSAALLDQIPSYNRPAFLLGQTAVLTPVNALVESRLLQQPTTGVYIIRVTKPGWASWPIPLRITGTDKTGWMVVYGALESMTSKEKKKYGLPIGGEAGKLTISKMQSCALEYCGEWEDIDRLIQARLPTEREGS